MINACYFKLRGDSNDSISDTISVDSVNKSTVLKKFEMTKSDVLRFHCKIDWFYILVSFLFTTKSLTNICNK